MGQGIGRAGLFSSGRNTRSSGFMGIELFARHPEFDAIIVLTVKKGLSPAPPFFDKAQLFVQPDRCLVGMQTGRIALLISLLPEPIAE